MWFSALGKFLFQVCVLCGCLLPRQTEWLNQYKWPLRSKETIRKCSIIKLNYRQTLKRTNKYFVTTSPHFFFYGEDDWKCLQNTLGTGSKASVWSAPIVRLNFISMSVSIRWESIAYREGDSDSIFLSPNLYLVLGKMQYNVTQKI